MNDVRAVNPKWMTWTGWILTMLPVLMMGGGMIAGAFNPPKDMDEHLAKMGWTAQRMAPLMWVSLICLVLYVIPQTAVLGAILLTGYLGGAVATHVRIDDGQSLIPVAVGVVVWLGIFFREPRLRAILPLRSTRARSSDALRP